MFKKAVLIIHGFAGNTSDNEALAHYIELNSNFDVYSFTLKGHEKMVLKDAKYSDWINDSETMLKEIQRKYKRVYLVGHSMGGVIASHLAVKYKIKKLVLIAPAFEYTSLKQNKKDIPNISRIIEESNDSAYEIILSKIFSVPIPSILQFVKLIKKYKNTISNVNVPTLIVQGDIDEVIPFKSSEFAFNNIKSKKKYITKIQNVRHAVLKSKRKIEISNYIYIFLRGGFKWKRTYKQII